MPTIEVPPLPVAYDRALRLLKNPDPSVDELAAVIEKDPSLTASVIRAANSALSSPVDPISTVRGAVVRVGATDTRRMVIANTMGQAFRGMRSARIDEHEMWRHLMATAVIADMLATNEEPQAEAFTAGLLHDIGRMAMAAQDPSTYARVIDLVGAGVDAIEAERELYGMSHPEWGEAVARHWDFPEELVLAIADHHEGAASELAWLVSEGRRISASLGIGDGLTPPPDPPDAAAVSAELGHHGGAQAVHEQVRWFERAIRRAA